MILLRTFSRFAIPILTVLLVQIEYEMEQLPLVARGPFRGPRHQLKKRVLS